MLENRFTSYNLRHRPDQTVYTMNKVANKVDQMQATIRLLSEDGKSVIIIGNQPENPTTHKPYPFGIRKYAVKGDRLEPQGELQWS